MSLAMLLRDTADILRKSQAVSATTGAVVSTWATVGSSVPCAVQPAGAFEDDTGKRETGRSRFRAYFLTGTDVQHTDRLAWNGRTLTVTGGTMDQGGRGLVIAVDAEEVLGGGTR